MKLKEPFVDAAAAALFSKYSVKDPFTGRYKICRQRSFRIAAFCLSGREAIEAMAKVISLTLKGYIAEGLILFRGPTDVLINDRDFLTPIYRAFVGQVYVILGDPTKPEFQASVLQCSKLKRAHDIKFIPGMVPYGGVPELVSIFPHVQTLQLEARVASSNVLGAFPKLKTLSISGSVKDIERFFENVGYFPALWAMSLDVGGNIEDFFKNFVHGRFPKLTAMTMTAAHISPQPFVDVGLFARFLNQFAEVYFGCFNVLQTKVAFNYDPGFYTMLHQTFLANPCNAALFVTLQHVPGTSAYGETVHHEVVREVLQPVGYVINIDNAGYFTILNGDHTQFEHHVLVDMPPLAKHRRFC